MICVWYNYQQAETPQCLRLTASFNQPCRSVQKVVTETLLSLPWHFSSWVSFDVFFLFPFFILFLSAIAQVPVGRRVVPYLVTHT